jgi:hypothetical protein
MKTWYRVSGWSATKIQPVEIARATKIYVVFYGGRKASKLSDYESYFPTWKEAYEYALTKFQKKLEVAESRLDYAKKQISKFKKINKKED